MRAIVQSLRNLMAGRLGPVHGLNDGGLHLRSIMTARVYDYGLLRVYRLGAELADCSAHD